MARSSRQFRTAPRARRRRVWARQRINQGGISTAGPQQIDLLGGLKLGGAQPLGWTVGPIIFGQVGILRTSATTAVLESAVVGARIGASAIEAVDQDPSSTGTGLDWMFFQEYQISLTTAGVLYTHEAAQLRSNAMRKLDEINETLWLVMGTTDTATYTFNSWVSVLCILP